MPNHQKNNILYDNQCGLCTRSITFIKKRHHKNQHQYTPLQTPQAHHLLSQHHLPNNLSTLVLIQNNQAYTHSTAVLHIAKTLTAPWPTLYYLGILIPRPLRDLLYRLIAHTRPKTTCKLETPPNIP